MDMLTGNYGNVMLIFFLCDMMNGPGGCPMGPSPLVEVKQVNKKGVATKVAEWQMAEVEISN